MTLTVPCLVKVMISSRLEHSHKSSSFFRLVPIKPSVRLMYSLVLVMVACLGCMVLNSFISVLRSFPLPYFFKRSW